MPKYLLSPKDDMDQITEHIYLGSWKAAKENVGRLEIVTTAIDSPFVGDYHFPLTDPGTDPNDRSLLFDAANKVIKLTSQGKDVLVHCVSGANRSVSVVMAVLMKTQGMSLEESYKFVLEKRRGICPYYKNLEHVLAFNDLPEIVDKEMFGVKDAEGAERIVYQTYEGILGRKADPDGLRHYTELLERGKIDQVKLAAILKGSDEYRRNYEN